MKFILITSTAAGRKEEEDCSHLRDWLSLAQNQTCLLGPSFPCPPLSSFYFTPFLNSSDKSKKTVMVELFKA